MLCIRLFSGGCVGGVLRILRGRGVFFLILVFDGIDSILVVLVFVKVRFWFRMLGSFLVVFLTSF